MLAFAVTGPGTTPPTSVRHSRDSRRPQTPRDCGVAINCSGANPLQLLKRKRADDVPSLSEQ